MAVVLGKILATTEESMVVHFVVQMKHKIYCISWRRLDVIKYNYYVVDTISLNYYLIINKIFQDLALSYDPVFTVENLKPSLCFFHLGLGPLSHLIPKSLHF